MKRAKEEYGVTFRNHSRRAKRRMVAILNAGTMKKRIPLYRDLIKATSKVLTDASDVADGLSRAKNVSLDRAPAADGVVSELRHFADLGRQVVEQTRRVLDGQSVPVNEKLVSIFDTHTDILVKGRRKIETVTRAAWPLEGRA